LKSTIEKNQNVLDDYGLNINLNEIVQVKDDLLSQKVARQCSTQIKGIHLAAFTHVIRCIWRMKNTHR